jgi:oxygen-independent coproporphyrinogen III oxidase
MKIAADLLDGPPLVGYTYSYPHKTAHRPLSRPVRLGELWSAEDRGALSLYLHVPFCKRRCSYCNLFSLCGAEEDLVRRYLDAVQRQAQCVRAALHGARFARMAIGGGTPTFLDLPDLERLLVAAGEILGASSIRVPASVEVSPSTAAEGQKLALLRQFGISRLSIGVQTFDPQEAAELGRPQPRQLLERALRTIREAGFPVLNLDLIYGIPGQTLTSWQASLRAALAWRPEELFLYPLYMRPLTGLASRPPQRDDLYLAAYRAGRDLLLAKGYTQHSMRMFRAPHVSPQDEPPYCRQEDGMVGLGCGARSYTRALHYSTAYAVRRGRIREIVERFAGRTTESFDWADYGFHLDSEDQRRRYVLLSLLECGGLDLAAYRARFASDPLGDLPELNVLGQEGLLETVSRRLRLTDLGLERSDAIGPWLYSQKVRQLMEGYPLC